MPKFTLHNADCLDWLASASPASIHAVVTDPPFVVKDFSPQEQAKLRDGTGGMWRQPPKGRAPIPRFTELSDQDKVSFHVFFSEWAKLTIRAVVPGAHLMIATNPLVSHLLYGALAGAGWEKRGVIVRLVQTLRGGDRPKNAESEFEGVSVMPRSGWEEWGLFRRPLDGRVQDNLRKWGTGALRRESSARPFTDVIPSERTSRKERDLSPHPSLKPQRFMRALVRASLPTGEGIVFDPFAGGGSTLAAAEAVGYTSVGTERDPLYYAMASAAIPRLAALGGEQW
jgi:DNA modification methylase